MSGAVEKAYVKVRERIVRGDYPPSTRITEQEISDAVSVSRTPAREALRRLQAEGFVTLVPNQGAIVSEWSGGDISDIFDMRELLESFAAGRAARRITPKGIAELRQLATEQFEESERRPAGYLKRIGKINGQFHHTLHEHAASPRLVAALSSLIEAPLMLQTFSSYKDEELVRSAQDHLELVRALEAGDPEWASAVMRAHILAARGRIAPERKR